MRAKIEKGRLCAYALHFFVRCQRNQHINRAGQTADFDFGLQGFGQRREFVCQDLFENRINVLLWFFAFLRHLVPPPLFD